MSPHASSVRSGRAGRPSPTDQPTAVAAVQAARAAASPRGEPAASNPWHPLLYERLRDEGLPVVVDKGTITPAGSLWTGARLWTHAFREASLQAGDRLVLALPPSTAFVQVLIAALWEGLTVAIATPTEDVGALCDELEARGAVGPQPGPHTWTPAGQTGPHHSPDTLRTPAAPPTPHVRFLMRTSGTTQLARWIALSDRNVLSVLASHLPRLTLRRARVLSVLPWSHAFGLVLELLPALMAGAEIIRDPDGGRDPAALVQRADTWGATHLSSVPLTIQRLLEVEGGTALLRRLHGGIVGGAPVPGPLAEQLSETRLRAGYGQTEAAPGITLGPPGRWAAHYLGRPLGCSVDVTEDDELRFHGPNAYVGVWRRHEGLDRRSPDGPVHTGDLVRRDGDDLYFEGRKDTTFSLSNGRLVPAGALEGRLKRAHPALHDALLYTPDGTNVALALCAASPAARPSEDALRDTLGALGTRLVQTTVVPPDDWAQRPKGTVDRAAMTDRLRTGASLPGPSPDAS